VVANAVASTVSQIQHFHVKMTMQKDADGEKYPNCRAVDAKGAASKNDINIGKSWLIGA
jgi:hypothetical protein